MRSSLLSMRGLTARCSLRFLYHAAGRGVVGNSCQAPRSSRTSPSALFLSTYGLFCAQFRALIHNSLRRPSPVAVSVAYRRAALTSHVAALKCRQIHRGNGDATTISCIFKISNRCRAKSRMCGASQHCVQLQCIYLHSAQAQLD